VAAPRIDLLATLAPLARALRRVEDAAAARADLTMWQYAILSVVAESPGLNQGAVAGRLEYSPNRIIADLDLLEQRGLLTRHPGADRRSNELTTTATGRRVVRRVRADIHRSEDDLLAALPVDQRHALLSATDTIADALRSPGSGR
jgi:MarR family transcriptional regulator, transcriptional regulator for hemolysin